MSETYGDLRLVCDECEGEIDLPDEFADSSCCTACGVAYFFQAAEQQTTVKRASA